MPIEVRQVMSAPPAGADDGAGGDAGPESLLRELAPQVLGAVVRRFGDFAAAEDAVQEALLAAATQWPRDGLPDNPRGWLIHVAAPPPDRPGAQRDRRAGGARPSSCRDDAARPRRRPTPCRRPSRTTRSTCSSCAAIRR